MDADAELRSYVEAKQAVAELLREITEFSASVAPWATERVRALTVRLAEDHFQLVVVGQFKRGKTSLMNAIIGRPLLPTGSIPVTSAITSLRFGPTLRAIVHASDSVIPREIPVEALSEYVTERGNPANIKKVVSVDVEVPARFLRRGLHFIDTPGIGSAHERNTVITLDFLPEADAAVFVTGADAPLSEIELDFLDTVRQHVRKLFFVLNKVDQLTDNERDEVLAYTSQQLARRLGVDTVRIFPLSATRALVAEGSDSKARAESGLPALETALAAFLNDERQHAFLVAVLDRTIRLLDEMRFTLDMRRRVESTSQDSARIVADMKSRYRMQEQERHAVVARADQLIASWEADTLEPALSQFVRDEHAALSGALGSESKTWGISDDPDATARQWLHDRLQASAHQWLESMAGPVTTLAQEISRQLQPDIAAVIGKTLDIAGAAAGVHEKPTDASEAWTWIPTTFAPPTVVPGLPDIASHSPHATFLPFGVHLAARRTARQLQHAVEEVADGLRQLIVDYLESSVHDLETSSARAVAERRQLVEPSAESHDEPHQAGSAADIVAALLAFVQHATTLRQALLEKSVILEIDSPLPPVRLPAHIAPTEDGRAVASPSFRFVRGTCAICAIVSDALFDFLCQQQYAIAVERSARQRFLTSGGLCPTHTWHLERIASPRGLSLSYPSLMQRVAARLNALADQSPSAVISALRTLTSHSDSCAVCAAQRRAEREVVERLVGILATSEGRGTFERSYWLCTAHLAMLVNDVDAAHVPSLLRVHAARYIDTAESMQAYVLKFDARRRTLLTRDEEQAYRQALVLLVGERYLFTAEGDG